MIRTADELLDRIASELVWRRRELTDLRALVQQSDGTLRSRVIIRASVALLYAHWEGFVKKTASYYVDFVASQRLPYRRLKSNFLALALRARFESLGCSNKLSAANDLAEFFSTKMDSVASFSHKNSIDTKSNLSSKVLLDIITVLGISKEPFETRFNFIDSNLVNPRNHIAHGEVISISVKEYLELHDGVLALIESFRNEIENSSVLKVFDRNSV
jgi:hypothetical protein